MIKIESLPQMLHRVTMLGGKAFFGVQEYSLKIFSVDV
jgi:hypothetical protein